MFWRFIRSERLLDVRNELTASDDCAFTRFNYSRDRLTEFFIWNSNCDRIENRWVGLECLLDFFREHLFTTGIDAHRAPPKQRDRTVIFNDGKVTGARVTLALDDKERTRSFCFVFVVAKRLTTADRKPTLWASARRQDVVVLVNHHAMLAQLETCSLRR